MPPKRRHSSASLAQLRQAVAQRFAPPAPIGAPEDEAASPPLQIQSATTAPTASTEQSSTTSTATTGRSCPRSISCKSRGDSADTSISTSSATRCRGICICRKTQEEVRKTGKKIPFPWSDELKLQSDEYYQGRLSRDIGIVVRDAVPMRAASYWELPQEDQMIVFNNIYTYYDVSLEHQQLFDYIQTSAASCYKDWMSNCRCYFEKYGPEVPDEFVHRVEQWTWLTEHFSSKEDKARSQRMKGIRVSQNKVDHASGSTPFAYRAKKRKASIASFEASNLTPPPVEDGSDSTSPTPIVLPLQTQIDVLQGEVGVRRGTAIRGMGSGFRRDPQTRGGARLAGAIDGDLWSTVELLREDNKRLRRRMAEQEVEIRQRLAAQEEEIRQRLAAQKEARLQQQRQMADMQRQMADMQRQMADMQRQIANMQRQLFELLRRDASGGSSTPNQQPPQP